MKESEEELFFGLPPQKEEVIMNQYAVMFLWVSLLDLGLTAAGIRLRTDIKKDNIHHIIGVPMAEKILKKLKYSKAVIEEVKHSIASHRASKGLAPKTMIAKIIANADAMAHFDTLPLFFYWKAQRKESVEEIINWSENKIQNNWDKKLTLPEAKKLVRKKYDAVMFLLKEIKKHSKVT